ncbi:hypothetical protein NW761_007674 [Fusarium oxysporum]|nr:hypothetical protein NW763_010277 [Fusarium oxysporum]KAJ4047263.1 hypothetical protein NW758_005619 [Fusarium oxysporum]KAJ4047971.1 hypothetical protein NW753_008916 [Fusarium oxysporum]KAJ4089356.1 hypothetical protein NW761_007674 [Fusarium oxysporum]KAJ4093259.1 hypothetical protein NW756_005162 [Fusarium oxysporum]
MLSNSWSNSWKEGVNSDATTNDSGHIHHEQMYKQQDASRANGSFNSQPEYHGYSGSVAACRIFLSRPFHLYSLPRSIFGSLSLSKYLLLHSQIYSFHCFNPLRL